MRISDWSSAVCSSDLMGGVERSCRLALRSAQRLADGGEIGVDRRLHRVLAAELLGAQQQAVGGERVMLHTAPGGKLAGQVDGGDRKSTRLNSSHSCAPRMPSSA